MIIDELKYKILQQFGFPPTQEQAHALEVFAEFLTDRDPHAVMILRGSAGTGKTTLSGRQDPEGDSPEGDAPGTYG